MAVRVKLGWREFKPTFGGGGVSCDVRPLLTDTMLEVSELLEKKRATELQKAMQIIIPNHVRNLAGLVGDDDKPLAPELIGTELILRPLAMELAGELMTISTLSETDSKNSAGPAGESGQSTAEDAAAGDQ